MLQGHPVTHALGDTAVNNNAENANYKGKTTTEIVKMNENLPDYMDLTRPSTLSQPDWDTREYKATEGIELTNTKLHIGKHAEVSANITANNNSEVIFGGDKIKHYIDKFDADNTTGDGFTHHQEITSEVLSEKNRGDDTIKFNGAITADSSTITSNIVNFNPSSIDLKNNSTLNVTNLNIDKDPTNIEKDDTSRIKAENFTLSNVKDFNIDKITKNSEITNTILKNATANGSDLNTNLTLKKSTLTLSDKFTLKDKLDIINSTINTNEINAENKTTTINISNGTLKGETFKAINSTIDIKNSLSGLDVKNIDAKNNSKINIDSFKMTNSHSLSTDNSSYLNFNTLSYDANNQADTKEINANVKISNMLHIQNVGTMIKDGKKEMDFKQILELSNDMVIKVDFSSILKKDEIEQEKEYEILSANTLRNNNVKFSAIDPEGLFAKFEIKDNKLYAKFSEKNLKDIGELSKASGLVGYKNKKILSILSNSSTNDQSIIENAARTGDFTEIKERVAKIDSDFKTIADNALIINTTALFANNNMINTRLSQLTYLRASADMSGIKLAGLESDATPSLKLVLDAMEAQRHKNNFWANINGGYFNEKSTNGDLKFYGANFGYDQAIEGTELTLGAMMGFGKSKYEAKNFKDDSKIYNFGAYSFYNGESFEVQNNLNFAFIRGDRYIASAQKAKVKSTGILSSNYLKYKIELKNDGDFSHTIKPVFALELGANGISGFNNGEYKQKDFNNFNAAVGVGVEYAIASKTSAYSAQLLAKQNIYHSKNKPL
ncbi:hypothetical protein LMG8286_01771 [Campylobacter suis]|uniref:Autotransporter domain-containing protein n=1 Tax=Campylobacter suis TaxID=2790657 RepID=A0ABM8Q8Q5_9BACT|nr:autotransporter outer membrane beta-barrel domain-containing protein [Campylobacter suis]CAD7289341.1 hypothetical protein LMG8286_01771 [Campylobacter suis]